MVIDAMSGAALQAAPRFRCPTGVAVHTFPHRQLPGWHGNLGMQSQARERAGFDGAPVLASETRPVPAALPWEDADPTPLVLVSYSTVPGQRSPEKLQRTLDALAGQPVRVVVTTRHIVEPDELDVPGHAYLVSFADHGPLLDRAALLVGHGGHGTTMRCLAKGVPMVLSAAKALDQAGSCATVQEWGAGRALPADADTAGIRAAAQDVIADPARRDETRRRATALAWLDGAALAADSYEALLTRPAGRVRTALAQSQRMAPQAAQVPVS